MINPSVLMPNVNIDQPMKKGPGNFSPGPSLVWLPVPGKLRTVTLTIPRVPLARRWGLERSAA
jgi:hypothetical protein